jgi:hypothetical protein
MGEPHARSFTVVSHGVKGPPMHRSSSAPKHRRSTLPRWRARLSSLLALGVCIGALTGVSAHPATTAATRTFVSGVKADGGPSGDAAFGVWRAKTVGLAHAFAPGDTWADISLPSSWLSSWAKSAYRTHMLISLPMLPAQQTASMSGGASGAYDGYFRTAAKHLVADGMGNATLRVGWEFNGGWFKWSAKSNPSAYAGFYRHIVNAMRSVSGQSFRFVWSLSNGYFGWDPRKAYPGDAYVSYIGDGLYDCFWRHPSATPAQRWNNLINSGSQPAGLSFWTAFAASHSKPVVLPEWALVNSTAHLCGGSGGGGDDTYFIQQVYNWTQTHNVAWETYFDQDPSDGLHRLQDSQFRNAASRYRTLFGGA